MPNNQESSALQEQVLIAKRLVEMMGGDIGLETGAAARTRGQERVSSQAQALQGKRVLIVEDNDLVAKFFRMALERAGGCSCLISEDVPVILEHVASGEIDLVLLDVSLNNSEWEGRPIGGVELCRMLKEKSPRRLPVLLATAHAMSGDRERLLQASGADGYLEKPV